MKEFKSTGWHRFEILKIYKIIEESSEPFMHKDYLLEKLGRIYNGTGIGAHPVLENVCRRVSQDENKDCDHKMEMCIIENGKEGVQCTKCGAKYKIVDYYEDQI